MSLLFDILSIYQELTIHKIAIDLLELVYNIFIGTLYFKVIKEYQYYFIFNQK